MKSARFGLDWRTLTAEIDNLIIHGTEPADAAPLLAVKRVVIGFKILSFIERRFNVARVEAEGPQAHLMIEADGSTNLPHPKIPNGKTGPETILALKIGKFDLANGTGRGGTRGREERCDAMERDEARI